MSATGIAITNPLVKYRSLLATKAIAPDQGQLRLALHLQKLYDRLKDYEPAVEYSRRLDQLTRHVEPSPSSDQSNNPAPGSSSWRSLLAAKERRDSLALTRRLTDHESAIAMQSPRGLLLHGEVGTGKSMLVDLFADCLPTRKKARLHFSTFMLQTFARLEAFRREGGRRGEEEEEEYSLLRLAREMAVQHPVLFLDEFQMPDRVAAKILTNLMTSFFHLGGVLVATSNRMPEELAKASGVEFAPPPSSGPGSRWSWAFGGRKRMPDRFAGPSEFSAFLDVLKARCEVWEMEGGRDWRRMESGRARAPERGEGEVAWLVDGHEDLQHAEGMAGWPAEREGEAADAEEQPAQASSPRYYAITANTDGDEPLSYSAVLQQATGSPTATFHPTELRVYGRRLAVPRAYQGTTQWTFDELCKHTLGPADYSSLASAFHTLLLTDVPVLTWLMKNEARRFITLLDALYECRCKLYIRAAAGPDALFFPDQRGGGGRDDDAIAAETFSEAYQDATAPFRPNILSQNPNYVEQPSEPDYTHARLAGLLNADAIEDEPPNKPHGFARSFGRTDAEMERAPIDPDEVRRPLDFGKAGAFTGEDERFAYKRAQSRLWEMCGAKWWARTGEGWHRPLPAEVRRWERSAGDSAAPSLRAGGDAAMGAAVADETRDARSFKPQQSQQHSPFRATEEPPPRLDPSHIWSLGLWGKRAGTWGKGTEGLKERRAEEEEQPQQREKGGGGGGG